MICLSDWQKIKKDNISSLGKKCGAQSCSLQSPPSPELYVPRALAGGWVSSDRGLGTMQHVLRVGFLGASHSRGGKNHELRLKFSPFSGTGGSEFETI